MKKHPLVWFQNRIGLDVMQYRPKENVTKIFFLTQGNIKAFYYSQGHPFYYKYEIFKNK